jgi:hypothetical protein
MSFIGQDPNPAFGPIAGALAGLVGSQPDDALAGLVGSQPGGAASGAAAGSPNPAQVRTSTTQAQGFPFSMLQTPNPAGAVPGPYQPQVAANPQTAAATKQRMAIPSIPPGAGSALGGMPTGAPSIGQDQQGGGFGNSVEAFLNSMQSKPPVPPTLGPNPQEQQDIGNERSQGMYQMQQAQAARLRAAQQPLPQEQRMTLLSSLIPALMTVFSKSPSVRDAGRPTLAQDWMGSFQQAAQGRQQQAMQNYQQMQNAANVESQGIEQQAQTHFGLASSMLQQVQNRNELLMKQYASELGPYGKGLQVAGALLGRQVSASARMAATQYTADARSDKAQNLLAMGAIFDKSGNITPQDKMLAIAQLQKTDPDFAQLTPDQIGMIANQTSPAYQLKANRALMVAAQAQKLSNDVKWQDRMNDAKWQETMGKAGELAAQKAAEYAIAGRSLADKSRIETVTQDMQNRIQQWPDEWKDKAAQLEGQVGLNQIRAAQIQQNMVNKVPGADEMARKLVNDQIKVQTSIASEANNAVQKYVVNGQPPTDPAALRDYTAAKNIRDDAQATAKALSNQLKSLATNNAQHMQAQSAAVQQSPRGARSFGTNPNQQPTGMIRYAGDSPGMSVRLPNGKIGNVTGAIKSANTAVAQGRMDRATALNWLRGLGVTGQ